MRRMSGRARLTDRVARLARSWSLGRTPLPEAFTPIRALIHSDFRDSQLRLHSFCHLHGLVTRPTEPAHMKVNGVPANGHPFTIRVDRRAQYLRIAGKSSARPLTDGDSSTGNRFVGPVAGSHQRLAESRTTSPKGGRKTFHNRQRNRLVMRRLVARNAKTHTDVWA